MKNNPNVDPNGYHNRQDVLDALEMVHKCPQSDEKGSDKGKPSKGHVNALDQVLERHKRKEIK